MPQSQRTCVVAALLALTLPHTVSAQICTGSAARDAGAMQVSGGFSSTTGVKQFDVSARGIGERAFGGLSLGSISYDELTGSTLSLGVGTGYRVPVGTSGNGEICPVIGGFIGMGPNDIEGSGVDASIRGVAVGISAGYRITSGTDISIVPTAGIGFEYSSFRLTDGIDSTSDSDSYGMLSLGVGLILGRQFTALPSVSIPIGLDNSDPILSLTFALSIGARR